MTDQVGEARSKALYQARIAYGKEARRLRKNDAVNSRCLIVAIDAFNAELAELMSEDGDVSLIDDSDS